MSVQIESIFTDSGSVLFSVVSGDSCLTTSYEWYLNNNLVGTESTYNLIYPISGDVVYVKVKNFAAEHCPIYWHDGQFYGGRFIGNFAGGTFYYGYLNSCQYVFSSPKQKPFIEVSK